ncbi:hypothetical protein ABFX02_04G092700 [Erythranthe guttata]
MAIIHVLGSSIFFFYILLSITTTTTSSISESESLLKLKQSFTNATSLDSWNPTTEPCSKNGPRWIGVICDSSGVVSSLRLGNLGLSGKIDVDALVPLSGLRSIAFMSNAFAGPIPEFHRMVNLKGLYLSDNGFSGEIPSDYFTKMMGLKKVWLSGNSFTGPIPYSLSQLFHLMELHLEDNRFFGNIPPLDQTSLVSLNLSNNNLEGDIPMVLSKFGPDSFRGNPGLCSAHLGNSCSSSITASSERLENSSYYRSVVNWILVVSGLVFLLMVIGIFVLKRRQDSSLDFMLDDSYSFRGASSIRRKSKHEPGRDRYGPGSSRRASKKFGDDIVMISDEKGEFGMSDLMRAAAEVLGNGALGSSYKATMGSGFTVVVKRVKEMAKMGKEQFDVEMRRLGSLKHENVLAPLAYHYRKEEKLLVYEYQPKGNLLFLLHGDRGSSHAELTWPVRLKIIKGIARGLGYLHNQLSSLDLPHGDLKSSNVILTDEYEPLIVDYGFCSLISGARAAQTLTAFKSPEALVDRYISPKCDVYCLGVVILEIITGKFPSFYLNRGEHGGIDIVQWVQSAVSERKEEDLFDPDIEISDKDWLGEMKKVLHIGAACTESKPELRLDLTEAVRRIECLRVDPFCTVVGL